ncbi:GNAT family N-acetyltransferase [Mesobacillus jeotgali]|jgi:[ribosomal protein S5]-alanine N-acetyltransferase|uniref:GNAT family N-acetyltransferase n=1 Tax=Mesobacillus jeotgali TaxID=129985 RepID=A0ABY9VHV8_9BACI|nr:GNAT family N-acetyltransferase [Mesobacillus jeotgali]WNF23223.1 GNAT family N-acetyltransferase [Mesobacillus jeotgali]
MIYLETARLILRDWSAEDLEHFAKMNADQEVMKYFANTLSEEETHQFSHNIISELQTCGYGLYAVEVMGAKEFIGFIGFHRATFEADFTPCIEIGWRLKKEAWGQGYATEGAMACLEHGFADLGFSKVVSFTAEINRPSINVMKKIGMKPVKTFQHPKVDEGSPLKRHVLFQIEC